MTPQIDDSGPAYPCTTTDPSKQGMSVRMWLAGMAMQGLLSSEFGGRLAAEVTDNSSIPDTAFMIADRMIESSKKDNSND